MAWIKHIMAVPTASEQRCLRCCEVISDRSEGDACYWPGRHVVISGRDRITAFADEMDVPDCVAVDLSQREETVSVGATKE